MKAKKIALENAIDQLNNQKKQAEGQLNEIKNKMEILETYVKFVENKGFGYVKQQNDQYFEEMEAANKERLNHDENVPSDENNNSNWTRACNFENPYCQKIYSEHGLFHKCALVCGHSGPCGRAYG